MKDILNINLAKEYVDSSKKRRMIYWGIHLYILVCGLALVGIAYLSTRKLVSVQTDRQEIKAMHREFVELYPGYEDSADYISTLQNQLEISQEVMSQVGGILQERVDLAPVLLGLAHPLVEIGRLNRFELARKVNQLEFDVSVPMPEKGNTLSARDLMNRWRNDPALMYRLGNISNLSTERDIESGRPVMIFKFACTLKTGTGSGE